VKKEFTYHPKRVGGYPETHCSIMYQLTQVPAIFPGEPDRQREGRYYHEHPQRLKFCDPADVFQQPEIYVDVLPSS
jgi:hypothetical protein